MDPVQRAVREIASQILTGQVSPVEGAQRIAAAAATLEDPGELQMFGDLARDGMEETILEQASLLVADTA